jgi:hypothetical protein
VDTTLLLALVAVYVLGVVGIAVMGSIVAPAPDVAECLEERLSVVRAAAPVTEDLLPAPRFGQNGS